MNAKTNSEDMLDCPFCKSKPVLLRPKEFTFTVSCVNCKCNGNNPYSYAGTKKAAINKWNTRSSE
jgi:hypothetical protein